jgi:hypothetical protein
VLGDAATASIQTPLLAVAWERASAGDPAFAAEGLKPLAAHARWLCRERDPDGDGLITILLPDESGSTTRQVRPGLREARALAARLRAARAALPAGALERARVHGALRRARGGRAGQRGARAVAARAGAVERGGGVDARAARVESRADGALLGSPPRAVLRPGGEG